MRVGCVQEVRQVGTESAGLSASGAAFDGVDEGLSRNRTGGAAFGSNVAAARH